jgi:peptidoglycan/xylan/chitin deacetylase (PgdA/CDA1 family)
VVLTYHDMVQVRDAKSLWFDCTPAELTQQLDWLSSKGASFISVDQLYQHLTAGAGLPENAVLITFADNYRGFYDHALPILRERKIPTVMFVHTDFVGSTQGRPKMTWEQLVELDREGLITIASQTKSHPADLRKLSGKQLMDEIRGSKTALEERLGHRVRYLAYPNGKFNVEISRAASLAGYDMAFTEEQTPAEVSPGIFEVARYVHTKYQTAWNDATR